MAEKQAAQAVADPTKVDNPTDDSAGASMDETHDAHSMADPAKVDKSTNNSADTTMDNTHHAHSMTDPTGVDASMDIIHAAQAGDDLLTGGQTPILHSSPPHTPRLQPTREPNTEIDDMYLDSPLSSARSLSPPPHFTGHSPFSSPGPFTGPVTLAGLPQDSEIQEHADSKSGDEFEDDEDDSEDDATDQMHPEGAVADASAEVSKRNTTEQAKTKADNIESGGVPHANGRCTKCINGDHECVVNLAVSGGNTCSKCAEHKEKCSHQLKVDGYSLRTIGRKAAQPCNNCAEKIKQGIPTECFQASAIQLKKWGRACSECMIDGTFNTCSCKKKKARAKKSRAGKTQA